MNTEEKELIEKDVVVTPEIAASWLMKNLNVPFIKANREAIARDMSAGRWRTRLGDPIRFDEDGNLVDGQNRLWAIVETGKTFTMRVIYGIAKEDVPLLNTGSKKSNTLILGHRLRESHPKLLNGAADLLLKYESGSIGSRRVSTISEIMDALNRHPGLRKSAERVANSAKGTRAKLKNSFAVALDYLGSLVNEERAQVFIDKMLHGQNLNAGDPAYLLRNRLLDDSPKYKGLDREREVFFIGIQALNAALEGREIKSLRFKSHLEVPSVKGIPINQQISSQVDLIAA